MNLLDYLSQDYVFLDKVFSTKTEIIDFLLQKIKNHPYVIDFDQLAKDLWDRESKGGTGLEDGVALPHTRTEAVVDIVLAFMRLGIPVDFGSPDGRPAQFVFLLVVPKHKVEEYLEVVGHIMRIMKRESVRNRLMSCKSAKEVLDLFSELEVKR